MTTITWKGEDSLHPGGTGPKYNEWNGVRFKVGDAVDLDKMDVTPAIRAHMLAKAKRNAFYEVAGEEEPKDEPSKRGPGRPRKEPTDTVAGGDTVQGADTVQAV